MNPRQFLLVLLARKWLMLATIASTVAVALVVSLLLPQHYMATASIVIDFKAVDPITGNVVPVQLLPGYLATQLDILSSHNVALKAVDSLKATESPVVQEGFQRAADGKGSIRDWYADVLLKNIKLEPSRESSMVGINYRSTDPQFAAAVVNAFVQAYMATNLDLRIEPARQTTAFFNDQLQLLKQNLNSAQNKLSAYQREKGITATDERYDVENARLAELSTQVVVAQTQAIDSVSRRQQANDTMSDVLSNPVIQNIKNALASAEGKLVDLSAKVGPNHPQYQSMLAEVNKLKQQLADETSVVKQSVNTTAAVASQREGSLKSSLAAQRARVMEMKKQRDSAAVLQRDVDNAQRAYNTAMDRFTQTRLESQNNQTNVAILNPAVVPTSPSFPKLPLNLALAFVVGAALAVGLALVAEMLDRIVRCEEDILAVVGLPVLGSIKAVAFRQTLRLTGLQPKLSGPG